MYNSPLVVEKTGSEYGVRQMSQIDYVFSSKRKKDCVRFMDAVSGYESLVELSRDLGDALEKMLSLVNDDDDPEIAKLIVLANYLIRRTRELT